MKQTNGETPPVFSVNPTLEMSRSLHSSSQSGATEIAELRSLLIGAELAQLASIRERLDKLLVRAEDVSRVLPEAILTRSKAKDKQLTTALTPTVEAALFVSVKRNPQPLVEAMAPIVGPAIRQAIRNALAELTQRINQVVEQNFSFKGLRWRLESWRTGRPLAEIVLSNTLLYRVEQVFLIHKQTGLLLQHVSMNGEDMQDTDMVSSMLSAIQSFVQDSFGATKDELLESFQVGELTVDMEQGPQAFLAAVIRGNPPRRLRRVFLEALESIHLECAREFENFTGDSSPFVSSRSYLEGCLQTQTDAQPKKGKRMFSWGFRLLLFGLGAALAWWGYHTFQEYRLWSTYMERLLAEPGVVVVSSEKRLGHRSISGLRDPLAVDPERLLQEVGIDPTNVSSHWEPYQALHPQFVLARAKTVLSPPENITLSFSDGTLAVAGSASRQWMEDARRLARVIPGVTNFVEASIEGAPAVETGMGESRESREQQESRDPNANAQELQRRDLLMARERLEMQSVQFLTDTLDLMPDQDTVLREVVKNIRVLLSAAQFTKRDVKIEVVGHADAGGAPLGDQVLGLTRAERVIAELSRNGLTDSDLSVLKARVEDARPREDASEQQAKGKVSFRVKIVDRS